MHNNRHALALLLFAGLNYSISNAQIRDTIAVQNQDTIKQVMNMDAVYNRPTMSFDKLPVAIGGYLEANSIYGTQDGLSEGLSFQARRLTIFMSASITERIKFLTELEFEDGTKEIAIEFAAMDIALHPALNFRGE